MMSQVLQKDDNNNYCGTREKQMNCCCSGTLCSLLQYGGRVERDGELISTLGQETPEVAVPAVRLGEGEHLVRLDVSVYARGRVLVGEI